MMFLVRSTFWFGLVVTSMPLERPAAPVASESAGPITVADVAHAVTAACGQEGASCRAILGAVAAGLAASRNPRSAADESRRPSVNTLTAEDMEPPWRGAPRRPDG